MKFKRNKQNKGIDIDLTSMLDVIFIILMVVMCRVSLGGTTEKALNEQLKETQAQLDEAQAKLETYEASSQTAEELAAEVAIMTLQAGYSDTDPTTRKVNLLRTAADGSTDRNIEEITITPENESSAYQEIRSELEQFLTDNSGVPVLLSISDEHILYRDYVSLKETLDQIGEEHDNLYILSDRSSNDY
ncbi:hypothetical protein SAMN02910292_00514 [Lachnospiraceae bacterium XBB2008]|nr:hypothetical protein SAMN02910292_00514 [Lachnospiraceae bacterium XBB2008]